MGNVGGSRQAVPPPWDGQEEGRGLDVCGEPPPQTAARHQLCLGVPLWHVARIVADAVPMTAGWSDISMAGVTSAWLP